MTRENAIVHMILRREELKNSVGDLDEDIKAFDMAIEALEQTRWIPVSERLPERDVDVLTYHRNESYDYQYVSWIDDYSGEWAGFIGSLSDEVLAWMPLPPSYEPQESEDKE